ncbi:MAG: gluconokinase [Verrucomicrobiota bacterium]
MSKLILAFDIGTSSSRTALFDETGQRIIESTAQETYPLLTTPEGGAELEPTVLLTAIRTCLAKTLEFARSNTNTKGTPIAGIGVSCFWHSLIGTDSTGKPVTNIITWADARCREEAAELRRDLSEREVHATTGCMLRTSFWPAKLIWLKKNHPSLFKKVTLWMSPAEWLQQTLTGKSNCALGMATGTGLFNPTTLQWDDALLERCDVRKSQLLPLSDEPTVISGTLADEYPELDGVPWFPGIGDGAASNLGSGCTSPGLAAINVGTSAALRILCEGEKAAAPFGLFCYRVDAKRYLVGGAVSNAGILRAWCLRELKIDASTDLEEELAARPAPDHGLTVLPFWSAERAPTWNEDIRGSIIGINHSTTSIDLLQAITESTYHRIAQIAELLIESIQTPPKFFISGGIQKSPTTLQRLADVLNQPLYANPEPEASIRGAAIYAMEKLNIPVTPLPESEPLLPRPEYAERYLVARKKQMALEQLLERHFKE